MTVSHYDVNIYLSQSPFIIRYIINLMDYSASPAIDPRSSHYNYISNTSQQYEEQFWKLKAQKAGSTIQELQRQNQELNKRMIEMSRIEQELREKIISYQDDWKNRSRKLTTERASQRLSDIYTEDKLTSTNELERLYKEIRIIKNTHQGEITKLKEENKKLKKQLEEVLPVAASAKDNEEKIKSLSKIQEELAQFKRRSANNQEVLNRVRDQKGKLMVQNQQLRKDIQDMKLREAMKQKEEEEKLLTYRNKLEEMSEPRTLMKNDMITPRGENQKQESCIPLFSRKIDESSLSQIEDKDKMANQYEQAEEEISKLRRQVEEYQRKEASFESKLKFEQSSIENQRFSNQIKLKKLEGDLMEAKTQLSDVLRKLAPLLQKKRESNYTKESGDSFASLSILQIFLKKYKIQAF